MARPVIALLTLACIVFATKWISTRSALAETTSSLESAQKDLDGARKQLAARPGPLSDAQQAALLIAALQADAQVDDAPPAAAGDRGEDPVMLRRQLERAQSMYKRAEAARREANDVRQSMLRERQGLIDEAHRLQAENDLLRAAIIQAGQQKQPVKAVVGF